jgi:hypothetical protein
MPTGNVERSALDTSASVRQLAQAFTATAEAEFNGSSMRKLASATLGDEGAAH